jgi:hypothetical protein
MKQTFKIRSLMFALSLSSLMLGACLSDASSGDAAVAPPPDPGPGSNTPPTISGSPQSAVKIGEDYMFSPNATDPDGDTITFSVQNMPLWADFNTSNGQLSGQPTLGDIGQYDGVVISASDGQASDSTDAFSIDVTDVALGAATVSWTPPTENEDGSPLNNLAGFKLYYGTRQGVYTSTIQIDNPSINTYVVDNLIPDTYYFVSTAFNSNLIESAFSNEATKIVD